MYLIGVIFHEGHLAYLTEYIEGGTLQELLTQQETLELPWETYLNITLDVARGMAYLHYKGIIHRDLNSKVRSTIPSYHVHFCLSGKGTYK